MLPIIYPRAKDRWLRTPNLFLYRSLLFKFGKRSTNQYHKAAGRKGGGWGSSLEGGIMLKAVISTPPGPPAPTKSAGRSGLFPSTRYPGVPIATLGPGSKVAPPHAAAPPAFGRGCGSRKRCARCSELRPAQGARTAPQTQPAHPADPNGHPSKHGLGPHLRFIYTDGADRTGDAQESPKDHGDPGWASSGGQAGSQILRRSRRGRELLGP